LEQEQLALIDDSYGCSVRNSGKLLSFVDTIFYEVYSLKKHPIIERLQDFIKKLVNLEFSLPLLKDLLIDFQKMDASL